MTSLTTKNLIQSPGYRDSPPEKTSVVKQLIPCASVIRSVTGPDWVSPTGTAPGLNEAFITLSQTNQLTIVHRGLRACQLASVH